MSEKSLAAKIAEVMLEVRHIGRDGKNTHHKYDYTSIDALAGAVTLALASRGIIHVPKLVSQERTGNTCHITVEWEITDGKAGYTAMSTGEGTDNQDKATPKAWTSARKNFYLTTFGIARGDDPDADSIDRQARDKLASGHTPAQTRSAPRTVAKDAQSSPKLQVWNLTLEAIGDSNEAVAALDTLAVRYGGTNAKGLGEVHWVSILKDMQALDTPDARKTYLTGED